MSYKLVCLAAIAILVFGSCTKNFPSSFTSQKNSVATDAIRSETSSDTIAYVTNSANPYDSVGRVHDNGMIAIMPNYIGATLEPTQANAYSFTNSYLEGRGYSSTFLTQLDDSIDSRYDSSLFTISLGSLSQNLYSQGLISGKAYGYLQALSSSLNQFANDSATAGAYDSLCQDITSQEDYVLRDSTFMQSTIESRMVLSTMAIGRYSVGYWMNFHNSTQSVGGAVQACGWFSWSAVAGGDVVGAAAGALGGGAAGALAGGIGAGPGAVAGGLGGGISCSAYEAGMQIWHHFFK